MSALLTMEGSCGPVTPPQPRMAATMAHGSAPPAPSAAAASTSTRIPVASGGVQKRTGQHAAEAVRMCTSCQKTPGVEGPSNSTNAAGKRFFCRDCADQLPVPDKFVVCHGCHRNMRSDAALKHAQQCKPLKALAPGMGAQDLEAKFMTPTPDTHGVRCSKCQNLVGLSGFPEEATNGKGNKVGCNHCRKAASNKKAGNKGGSGLGPSPTPCATPVVAAPTSGPTATVAPVAAPARPAVVVAAVHKTAGQPVRIARSTVQQRAPLVGPRPTAGVPSVSVKRAPGSPVRTGIPGRAGAIQQARLPSPPRAATPATVMRQVAARRPPRAPSAFPAPGPEPAPGEQRLTLDHCMFAKYVTEDLLYGAHAASDMEWFAEFKELYPEVEQKEQGYVPVETFLATYPNMAPCPICPHADNGINAAAFPAAAPAPAARVPPVPVARAPATAANPAVNDNNDGNNETGNDGLLDTMEDMDMNNLMSTNMGRVGSAEMLDQCLANLGDDDEFNLNSEPSEGGCDDGCRDEAMNGVAAAAAVPASIAALPAAAAAAVVPGPLPVPVPVAAVSAQAVSAAATAA
eukprot:CAMPEP_0202858194 /NCGR_PEP_ID=MMETSP1391-20130828/828_1 /ASSEMBLY_ACC=CAM_ASM_000867 /TAXON_ID=1034604 /ORGANISM="Chlamydomonas leiostraca, Strain SAG 11-49" /LENGTH=572 /DNA_ID=CAMNT_0049537083 /DNA_START=319 /DNA_END=2037 /DNA_ORIENTATION=-